MDSNGTILGGWVGSFQFSMTAFDPTEGTVLSVLNGTARQFVDILHINHAAEIHASPEMLDLKWSLADVANNDNVESAPVQILAINGIQVFDALDFDLDCLRVDLWSTWGLLTLCSDYQSWANFDLCQGRAYLSWQCKGNGVASRNMTFFATPNQMASILSTTTYQSLQQSDASPWVDDAIVLRLLDGSGGPCLSPVEHEQYKAAMGVNNTWQRRVEAHSF